MGTSQAAAATDLGRERSQNDDALLVDEALGIYAVADGATSSPLGNAAAATAVEVVHDAAMAGLATLRRPCGRRELLDVARRAVERACAAVYELGQKADHAGAATTLTLLLVDGNRAAMAHVGDSRLYLVRRRRVEQLSVDHTLASELFRAAYIGADEARRHPFRHVLSRSLGAQPSVVVDTLAVDVLPGDKLLLTTDGLHDVMEDSATVRGIASDPDLERGAKSLVERAGVMGGRDNATVILVRIDAPKPSVSADAVDLISGISLFSGLDLAGRSRVIGAGSLVTVEPDQIVVDSGAPPGGLWMVVAGRLWWEGERDVELGPGAWFGASALVDAIASPATVTAIDCARLFHLPNARWARLARRRPLLAVTVLTRLAALLAAGREEDPHHRLPAPPLRVIAS